MNKSKLSKNWRIRKQQIKDLKEKDKFLRALKTREIVFNTETSYFKSKSGITDLEKQENSIMYMKVGDKVIKPKFMGAINIRTKSDFRALFAFAKTKTNNPYELFWK